MRHVLDAPPVPTPAVRARMQAQRTRDTGCELAVRRELHATGARFRVGTPLRAPGLARPVRPDVVHAGLRVAVFVDGCWWHGCPEHSAPRGWWVGKLDRNRERDRRQTAALEAAGWAVVRAWEHEDPRTVAGRVRAVMDARR